MTEPCQYGKDIGEIAAAVKEIREHLVGTMDRQGLISRVRELERWKRMVTTWGSLAAGAVLSGLCYAIFR